MKEHDLKPRKRWPNPIVILLIALAVVIIAYAGFLFGVKMHELTH